MTPSNLNVIFLEKSSRLNLRDYGTKGVYVFVIMGRAITCLITCKVLFHAEHILDGDAPEENSL